MPLSNLQLTPPQDEDLLARAQASRAKIIRMQTESQVLCEHQLPCPCLAAHLLGSTRALAHISLLGNTHPVSNNSFALFPPIRPPLNTLHIHSNPPASFPPAGIATKQSLSREEERQKRHRGKRQREPGDAHCSCSQFQQFLPARFTVMVPSWAILIVGAEHLQAITCSTRMESQRLAREGEKGVNPQPILALFHSEMPFHPLASQRPVCAGEVHEESSLFQTSLCMPEERPGKLNAARAIQSHCQTAALS